MRTGDPTRSYTWSATNRQCSKTKLGVGWVQLRKARTDEALRRSPTTIPAPAHPMHRVGAGMPAGIDRKVPAMVLGFVLGVLVAALLLFPTLAAVVLVIAFDRAESRHPKDSLEEALELFRSRADHPAGRGRLDDEVPF